jgi:N-terminal domain of anti-restriction factor ArdC
MARRPSPSRKPAARRTDPAPAQRPDVYQRITDTIIAQLEEGRVPWVQPWGDLPGAAAVGMPRNAQTERAYSGINVMLLWSSGMAAGYPTQRWLTFRQALSLGGNVRRGEKGTPVVYANRFTPEQERQRASQAGEEARSIAFLKQYTVFNCAQCDGLPEDLYVPPPPPREDLIEPRFRGSCRPRGSPSISAGRSRFIGLPTMRSCCPRRKPSTSRSTSTGPPRTKCPTRRERPIGSPGTSPGATAARATRERSWWPYLDSLRRPQHCSKVGDGRPR